MSSASMQEVVRAFRAIAGFLRRQDDAAWLDVDLTIAQMRALKVISAEAPIHGRGLAHVLGVGQPTVSKLVDQLVERGYVRREDDLGDRRVVWLHPTDAGRAIFERIWTGAEDRLALLLGTLEDDDLPGVCRALNLLAGAADRLASREPRTPSTKT